MLDSVFDIRLGVPIHSGLVTTGTFFDGSSSLVFAQSTSSLLVYSPFADESLSPERVGSYSFRRIVVAQEICALSSGRFPTDEASTLFIGSSAAVQALDVLNNKDVFFAECMDPASTLVFGSVSSHPEPLLLVGGSCTVQGYDKTGADVFWTSTGDVVTALALVNPTTSSVSDGSSSSRSNTTEPAELCVGSEDYNIRWFCGEVLEADVLETATPTHLLSLGNGCWAYALSNGSVGVYQGSQRLWHARNNSEVVSLACFDVSGEGQPQLVVGWANGLWEARNVRSGLILCRCDDRQKTGVAVAAALTCAWGPKGRQEHILMVVWADGYVRAYNRGCLRQVKSEEDLFSDDTTLATTLRALQEQYMSLQQEAATLQAMVNAEDQSKAIPASTKLLVEVSPSLSQGALMLTLRTTAARIHYVALFSNVLFGGAVQVTIPPQPQTLRADRLRSVRVAEEGVDGNRGDGPSAHDEAAAEAAAMSAGGRTVTQPATGASREAARAHAEADEGQIVSIPLYPTRLVPADLAVKCAVGEAPQPTDVMAVPTTHALVSADSSVGGVVCHVFELTRVLPKYAMFALVKPDKVALPQTYVSFAAPGERASRLLVWVRQCFPVDERAATTLYPDPEATQVSLTFAHVSTGAGLFMEMSGGGAGNVMLRCDDLEVLGAVVQDLAAWLGLKELAPQCHLPLAAAKIAKHFEQVSEVSRMRTQATGDLGGQLEELRSHVVLMEDARQRGRTRTAGKYLSELSNANNAVMAEHQKLVRSQQSLIDALKGINETIQLASRLRVGPPAAAVTALCRQAVAKKDSQLFIRAMTSGSATK